MKKFAGIAQVENRHIRLRFLLRLESPINVMGSLFREHYCSFLSGERSSWKFFRGAKVCIGSLSGESPSLSIDEIENMSELGVSGFTRQVNVTPRFCCSREFQGGLHRPPSFLGTIPIDSTRSLKENLFGLRNTPAQGQKRGEERLPSTCQKVLLPADPFGSSSFRTHERTIDGWADR